jgi:hypothetical protein
MDIFDRYFGVVDEDSEVALSALGFTEWLNFFLNPRHLRGSDFLMRWSQGVWSERLLIQAVNDTCAFFAIPYGPSGTAPEGKFQAIEHYFERLEKAGLGKIKRPDLLIFQKRWQDEIERLIREIGGLSELPFVPETDPKVKSLIERAVIAVECETSLWKTVKMPDFGVTLTPQRRLGGKKGLRKNAVVPTVIIKDEDRVPLLRWQEDNHIPIHVWQVFYDAGYGIAYDDAEMLIQDGYVEPTTQEFQAPGGATTHKRIYKIYYHYCYQVCEITKEPELKAKCIEDRNGHILPYVHFEGGSACLHTLVVALLTEMANAKNRS